MAASTKGTGEQFGENEYIDEEAEAQLLLEPGARAVPESEIRAASGPELEQWKLAAETELHDSFYRMSAVTNTTKEELAAVGGHSGVLPMKAVWTLKPGNLRKCRGCVCGNFATKDPTERVWTAQAETSSVMSGLRLAQSRRWSICKLDVKGAFMYAPIPEDLLIVVRPPKIWERLGLVAPDTLWTLRKAVYGLRCAPRAWGLERDRQFRKCQWTSGNKSYQLRQCTLDSQVWRIIENGTNTTLGPLLCYVGDMLLLMPGGTIREGLVSYLHGLWKMSAEVDSDANFEGSGLRLPPPGLGYWSVYGGQEERFAPVGF